MSLDPSSPTATSREGKINDTLADLLRRVDTLEKSAGIARVGPGSPPSTLPPSVRFWIDEVTPRLYVRKSNGVFF